MKAFRIADRRHPIFSGAGAMLKGGRWNSPGNAVIYASETYAGALLEVLVHANKAKLPKNQSGIEITIPDQVKIERVNSIPKSIRECRKLGDKWITSMRSAVLLVPSSVVKREHNVVINPAHPDFSLISASKPFSVQWDSRLFSEK